MNFTAIDLLVTSCVENSARPASEFSDDETVVFETSVFALLHFTSTDALTKANSRRKTKYWDQAETNKSVCR